MQIRELTNDEILASATVINPEDSNATAYLRTMAQIMQGLSQDSPYGFYVVAWPNEIWAVAYGDPSNQASWDNLLIKMYRQALDGQFGPLTPEGL